MLVDTNVLVDVLENDPDWADWSIAQLQAQSKVYQLAMPVSWKGTLQQYAGRLHRDHAGKTDVRIIDFVDTGHPALLRMWDKRQMGYRAMGYRVEAEREFSEIRDLTTACA